MLYKQIILTYAPILVKLKIFEPDIKIMNPNNDTVFTLWQLPGRTRTHMNSYIIRTAGDELIVIDGGTKKDTKFLRKFIRCQGNHVHAWLISHPHFDHVDALTAILKKPTEITMIIYTAHYSKWIG